MDNKKIRARLASDGSNLRPDNIFQRLFNNQRFLAIIGLIFLVMIIIPLVRTYSQRRLVEKEINEVKQQIDDFESQNQELKDLVAYLQSDQSLEEQARRNLNLKKPGEQVIVIEDKTSGLETDIASSSDDSGGNLGKWWRYFFE
ncbi:MAG: septum formation initiator family protein [Patescibacteria group bacterium]|jgi:cell division protein FtsL